MAGAWSFVVKELPITVIAASQSKCFIASVSTFSISATCFSNVRWRNEQKQRKKFREVSASYQLMIHQ